MKAFGVIALVLAILVGIAGGVVFAVRWWVEPENIELVATYVAENVRNDGMTIQPAAGLKEAVDAYLSMTLLIGLLAAAAILFVVAIIALAVAAAKKKKAIAAAAAQVEVAGNNKLKKALPFIAAGVLATAVVIVVVSSAKKKKKAA